MVTAKAGETYKLRWAVVAVLTFGCVMLAGCTGNDAGSPSQEAEFAPALYDATFDAAAAEHEGAFAIDTSHAAQGYLGAAATSDARLKLQVTKDEASYNYDLPADGSPIIVPANMGSGTYTARIMQNTSENRYVELFSTDVEVSLESEVAPFVRPNMFCNYTQSSACVAKAAELCADARTESDAFDAVYDFITTTIEYDYDKAEKWATQTGYVPDPDETLSSGSGICFDYACLMAAMLRSQGIPCKMLTGYVSPDNIYHAWDMIFIDGAWISVHISAPNGSRWARADTTFAASGGGMQIGDGSEYTDRYTY